MADFTQAQLEEMVVGKTQNPNVIFFEQAVLNVPNSKEAGRRVYDTLVYIKLSQPGVTDTISYQAQKGDIEKYPEEFAYFQQNRGGKTKPGVEIIPNLDVAHLQELRDYGILTVAKLAEMEVVPPHLAYAHRAAQVLNHAFEDMENDNIEEDPIEEETDPRSAIEKAGFQARGETERRRNVPETGGQELIHDALRLPIPTRAEVEAGETTEGHEEGGQVQRSNPIDPLLGFDNWKLEITY